MIKTVLRIKFKFKQNNIPFRILTKKNSANEENIHTYFV